MTIDTLNRFLVTSNSGQVIVMRPPTRMTRAEALNLAAWLVAMADSCGPPFEPTFDEVRKAVESA